MTCRSGGGAGLREFLQSNTSLTVFPSSIQSSSSTILSSLSPLRSGCRSCAGAERKS